MGTHFPDNVPAVPRKAKTGFDGLQKHPRAAAPRRERKRRNREPSCKSAGRNRRLPAGGDVSAPTYFPGQLPAKYFRHK